MVAGPVGLLVLELFGLTPVVAPPELPLAEPAPDAPLPDCAWANDTSAKLMTKIVSVRRIAVLHLQDHAETVGVKRAFNGSTLRQINERAQ